MNLLLIITTAFVVYGRTTNAFDVKHNLLILPPYYNADLVEESYTPGRMSYNITSEELVLVESISDTDLVGLNLTAPFLVTAIFKSYNGKSSCLFSIVQDDRIVMSLCIQPAGRTISRISLITELYSPEESISGLINENYKEKWFKIVVYVRDDKADIYVNYNKLPDTMILTKDKDVLLSKNMELNLAISKRFKFEGLIEEISLYTNADENTLRFECDEPRTIFDIFNIEAHSSENPNEISPQSQKYDHEKDFAECRREITSIKKDMLAQIENIKEDLNEKNENMTMLMRNEIREDIDQLLNTNEYLVQELKTMKEKIADLENQQKLSQNTEPTYRQKET